jgi:hypothetical protein
MTNEQDVYNWFVQHTNADGMVDVGCPTIASDLRKPTRTVQGCMQRLEAQGKVYLIGYRRYAVTALVE